MVIKAVDEVYRDFVSDGVPSSGNHDPIKEEIRELLTGLESAYPVDTIAELASLTIPSSIETIKLNGFYEAGDAGQSGILLSRSESGDFQSAGGAWWILSAEGLTPRMCGAKLDGSTNDSTAFTLFETRGPGAVCDLGGNIALVTAVPTKARYWNGAFKVGSTIYPTKTRRTEDPFDGQVVATDRSANLSWWTSGLWWQEDADRLWRAYLVGPAHIMETGGRLVAEYSEDGGETWAGRRTIFSEGDDPWVRSCSFGQMASGRFGGVVTTGNIEGFGGLRKQWFVYSDNASTNPATATWTTVEITVDVAITQHFVYGQLLPWPAAAGGHDTTGFQIATYAGTAAAKILRTANNGATWSDAVLKNGQDGTVLDCQEPMLVRVPGVGWAMFIRTSADTNLFCSVTDETMATWSAWLDTGAQLGANPVHALYDGGMVHVYIQHRDAFAGSVRDNTITHYMKEGAALIASGGDLSDVPPRPILTLADKATGYVQSCRDPEGYWYHLTRAGEPTTATAIGGHAELLIIRQRHGAARGLTLIESAEQIIENPSFSEWPRGTSFSGVTGNVGIHGRGRSNPSSATLEVTREDVPNAISRQFPNLPLYGLGISNVGFSNDFTGWNQTWLGEDAQLMARKLMARRALTAVLFGWGAFPSLLRAGISVNSTSLGTFNFPTPNVGGEGAWCTSVRMILADYASAISGVTSVSFDVNNGNVASEYALKVCGLFAFLGDVIGDCVAPPSYIVKSQVARYCRVFGETNSALIAAGRVTSTTSAKFPINFGEPMAFAPATLTVSAASAFRVEASADLTPSALAISAGTKHGATVTATIAGATANEAAILKCNSSSPGTLIVDTLA